MHIYYAVYFGSIVVINYKTKEPAIFFSLDKANTYAHEMNQVGAGGYFVVDVELKKTKKGKKK